MKIDFRKSCPSCENCDILACDRTKLDVGFRNAFADPIETPEETNVISTKLRRHDRYFIVPADKSQPMFFQTLISREMLPKKKTKKKNSWPLFMDGVQLTQG